MSGLPALRYGGGIYVPVIEVEQLCGVGVANSNHRARLAVLYNPEKDESLPYLGIHIQDIPRAYLAESATIKAASEMDVEQYLKCRVDDESLYRAIPDLDAIIVELKKEYQHEQAQPQTSLCGKGSLQSHIPVLLQVCYRDAGLSALKPPFLPVDLAVGEQLFILHQWTQGRQGRNYSKRIRPC